MAESLLNDPKWRPLLAILKGLRNGLVYGAKIRLPHALVMTFLFKQGTLWEKLEFIASATKQHAFNLAKFVTIYKTFRVVLSILVPEYKDYHAFVAGSIGGYLVFRQDNPVNNQIVMYLLARVSVGLVKLMFERTFPSSIVSKEGGHQLNNLIKFIADHGFEIEATVVWGLVMWLFTAHRHVLQPSLQASMDYLYVDSDSWESWWTLFIHNKKPKSE